jgi:hypothetical protein
VIGGEIGAVFFGVVAPFPFAFCLGFGGFATVGQLSHRH